MTDEIIVRLKVTSASRTPEQISDATGILCDHSWRIGEKRGKTILVEKTNGWVLNSKMPKMLRLKPTLKNSSGGCSYTQTEFERFQNRKR